jgi:hypothetical protein
LSNFDKTAANMYADARKIHLIEKVLKIDDESLLSDIESFIEARKTETPELGQTLQSLAGIWTNEEAEEIEKIIENSCENINPDDWK